MPPRSARAWNCQSSNETTAPGIDRQQILDAARQLAEILAHLQGRLAASGHEKLPTSFAAYVAQDLAALARPPAG